MFRFALAAITVRSAEASCLSDIEAIGVDFEDAGSGAKGIFTDCRGSDRTKCQADVDQFVKSIAKASADVDLSAKSCAGAGPECVAEIQSLSGTIGAIAPLGKKMADECAGQDKSIIQCGLDAVKTAGDVAQVAKEVVKAVSVCKPGSAPTTTKPTEEISRDQASGMGCDLCKEVLKKGIDAGVAECHTLCKKAGSLDGVCEQACDLVETECDGSVDCPSKVCGLVKLCSSDIEETSAESLGKKKTTTHKPHQHKTTHGPHHHPHHHKTTHGPHQHKTTHGPHQHKTTTKPVVPTTTTVPNAQIVV